MNDVWLVFKGWMNPDSSPSLYGVFSALNKAQEFASELRAADVARHLESYGERNGSMVWNNRTVRNICYDNSEVSLPDAWAEYWESYMSFSDNEEEPFSGMTDEVLYIQKVKLDAKDLRDRS
jgi:hypothetical protein